MPDIKRCRCSRLGHPMDGHQMVGTLAAKPRWISLAPGSSLPADRHPEVHPFNTDEVAPPGRFWVKKRQGGSIEVFAGAFQQ